MVSTLASATASASSAAATSVTLPSEFKVVGILLAIASGVLIGQLSLTSSYILL
jgi:hypothetical protein